jgi:hypothetical protein
MEYPVLSLIVILIGYSTFTLILIRAAANPPMNQSHPDNAYALLRYLNRDQYGEQSIIIWPLLQYTGACSHRRKKVLQ